MIKLFQLLGAVAGLSGLCVGVVLTLNAKLVRQSLMKKLNATQAYKVVRLAAIMTAMTAAIGIGSWTITSSMSSSGGKGGNVAIQTDETTGSYFKVDSDGGNGLQAGAAGDINMKFGKTTDTVVESSARGGSTTNSVAH
jgi:hypothetical protein